MGINQSKTPGVSRVFFYASLQAGAGYAPRLLILIIANASTINAMPQPSTFPGFSCSSHQENSTPQTGTASVLRPAILAGKLRSTKATDSRPAPLQGLRCKPGPRKRRAASLPPVAGRARPLRSLLRRHIASAMSLAPANQPADTGYT